VTSATLARLLKLARVTFLKEKDGSLDTTAPRARMT